MDMIHKNKIIYFLVAVAYMSLACSCLSREDFLPAQGDVSGNIEFVARPVSYNGQTVQTKATSVDDFENRIHNCYFMLFNSSGARVLGPVDMNAMLTTQRISKHEILSLLGSETTCTACFIANVPTDIVQGLTTLDAVNSKVLDIAYSSVDVQDTGSGNKLSSFVIPEFDLDGDGGNEPIQCLPMFGMDECNLANSDVFQISLKRLFAKVSINVSVSASGASLDIRASHLFNLPTSVRLAESGVECPWVKDAASFLAHQIEGPIDDDHIVGGQLGIGARDYEFYFYVPEYYLLPLPENTANFGDQKYKPQMFETGKRPVFVRLFGTYSENNENSNITYDLYLGEDAATSFTLKRNVHYMNSMVINGITNSKDGEGSTLDCRVEVTKEQFDEVEILGQTANCYIIGQPGTYKYPACKGVFKGGVNNIPEDMKCSKGTTLKPLYQDNSSVKLDNLTYDDQTKEFSFDVVSLDGGGGLLASNDANVILGLVYNEGGQEKIEWSWHIWIQSGTTLDINLGFFDFGASNQTYPNGAIMMDRNLGARPTTLQNAGSVIGAYYKYGHKEPFLDGKYLGGGESAYDWIGADKSQTDPCPPGYRVPSSSVWSGNATKQHTGNAFLYWNGGTQGILQTQDDIYYPYSGYVDGNQKVQSQGYGVRDTLYNQSFNIPNNQTELSQLEALNYTDGLALDPRDNTGPVKFTKVQYSKYDINNLGIAIAQDKMEAKYSYTEKGTDIITCTIQTGIWKRSGSFLRYKYTADYTNRPTTTLTGEQLKTQNETAYNRLVSVINGSDGSNSNLLLSIFFSSPESKFEVIDLEDSSYGYQVRCVKE